MFLLPGMAHLPDVKHKADQIRRATVVIVPTPATQSTPIYNFLMDQADIRAALRDFELSWRDPYYEIYRRSTRPDAKTERR